MLFLSEICRKKINFKRYALLTTIYDAFYRKFCFGYWFGINSIKNYIVIFFKLWTIRYYHHGNSRHTKINFWYKSWHNFVKWHRTGPDERKTFLTEGEKFVREKWRNLEHSTKVWIDNARLRRTFHRYGTLFDKSYTGNHSNLIHILFPRSFVDLIWLALDVKITQYRYSYRTDWNRNFKCSVIFRNRNVYRCLQEVVCKYLYSRIRETTEQKKALWSKATF